MSRGFETKNLVRFPLDQQFAATRWNLLSLLPSDDEIYRLQRRYQQKRQTREALYRAAYNAQRQALVEEGAATKPRVRASDVDERYEADIRMIIGRLGEALRAADIAARLTREATDAFMAAGRFTGPDPKVAEAHFDAARALADGWMMGVSLLGSLQARHDWVAQVANDPFGPSSKRRRRS